MAYQLTEEDRQIARQLASQRLQSKAPTAPAKNKGNFFTNSLSTAGGILGGIGGSFFGPGIGTAVGGAAGAGAGKWLENVLEGNKDAGEGVLGEAAFGTLGGIGKGFKALKGAGGALATGKGVKDAASILRSGPLAQNAIRQVTPQLASKASKGLENVGGRLLGGQSGITAAQARSMGINPQKALSSVHKRTGLTSLDDMAEVSRGMTGGKDSMLDMLTREAVGSTSGVKLPDLNATAKNLLDDMGSLVPESKRKLLLNNAVHAGTSARGGSKGSIAALADPQRALDQANAFRDSARKLSSSFSATPADKQLAKVYNSLAGTVEDAIYKSPGVGGSVPTLVKAGADDLLFKAQDLRAAGSTAQAKALEKIAVDLRGVKDVKGLRSFKKDFVDLGKIDAASAQAAGTRGIDGNNASGKLRNAIFDMAKPGLGGGALKASQALGGKFSLPGAGLPNPLKIAGTQLGGRALMGGLPGQSDTTAPDAASILDGGQLMQTNPDGSFNPAASGATNDTFMSNDPSAMTPPSSSIYTREAVAQDIQKDLAATGGANMDKYITLFEFLNPDEGAAKANATTQKALSQSTNADATLQQLEGILTQAGGAGGPVGGNISSFFGGLGLNNEAKTYNDLASGSVTQIAKALGETGAMSDSDRIAYQNLIPRITDTPEVAQAKFAALRERMATAKDSTLQYGASSDGIAEALASAGY